MDDLDALNADIRTTDFIAAVRLLECKAPDKPRLGYASRIQEEPVRLSQHVSLAFQNNEVSHVEETKGAHPYRLYCNFLGLLGSNGPLPVHYTEHALQRAAHHNDPTFRDFIDLFNHRMLSLFYRAIADTDPAINLDRGQDSRYSDFVAAVGGSLSAVGQQRDSLPDRARFNYAGWLGARTRSPAGVQALIKSYFDLDCEVDEFVGDWLPIPEDEKLRLGSRDAGSGLGVSTYAGSRVWSISHKIRLRVGPMSWQQYQMLRPGQRRNQELRDLVKSYFGDELDWELEMVLSEARQLSLDGSQQLGFGWLLSSSRVQSSKVSATKSREQLKIKSTLH